MFRASRNSIEDIWGQRTPYAGEERWPVRVDTGQFFLEEITRLASSLTPAWALIISTAARSCTATASVTMRETFGTAGQPCSYADVEDADCLFLIGSDMASTETVPSCPREPRERAPGESCFVLTKVARGTGRVIPEL